MSFYKILLASFGLVFLAELGDKTQLTALAFTTSSRSPWAVFLGTSLALVLASAIAVAFGEALNRIPVVQKYLPIASGVMFVLMGLILLVNVARKVEVTPAVVPVPPTGQAAAPQPRGAVFRFVIGTATGIEAEICDFLEALAAKVPPGPRRDTLLRLAAEDRVHLDSVQRLEGNHAATADVHPEPVDGAAFAELSAKAPRPGELAALAAPTAPAKPVDEAAIRAGIQAAIEREESTADYYLALARIAKVHEVRDAFRWLAMEDIRHAQTLCSLINPDGAGPAAPGPAGTGEATRTT